MSIYVYGIRLTTVNNGHIKNSIFTLYGRSCRDYHKLKKHVRVYNTEQVPLSICTLSDGILYVTCYTGVYRYKNDRRLIACIGINEGTVKFKVQLRCRY